ncbi:hypothetical protein [Trueperella bialowiezensis]|nr:hypothetical protein [Trueperella bialowiezensis]
MSAWLSVRDDDVECLLTSEGQTVAHVGTGLDDVVAARHPHAQPNYIDTAPRRVHWTWPGAAFIDLADAVSWAGEGSPIGSTAFLGGDILALKEAGSTAVHVHVPRLMTHSDLGLGFLGKLAGVELDVLAEPFDLSDIVARARRTLGDLRLTATYSGDLPLTGVGGMARAWHDAGADGAAAQNFERRAGEWVVELTRAAQRAGRTSLLNGPTINPRAGWAGVGGGLGMLLDLMGGQLRTIGEHLVSVPSDVDLVVYVCGAVGVDLPTGLHAAATQAQDIGVPVVLLTDSSGLRKGELPRLGLHGSYELRPERAFAGDSDDLAAISTIPPLLDDAVARIARTWGWDF